MTLYVAIPTLQLRMDAIELWSRVDSPWRHDCILACIAATWEALHSSNHLFLDLPGKLASENPTSTIPNNLCYTTLKPDIVMLTDSQLRVVELTVPMNSIPNILAAKERKQQKQSYNSLFSDILAAGKLSSITYSTLEIRSLGHYLPTDAHHSMELLFPEQHSINGTGISWII